MFSDIFEKKDVGTRTKRVVDMIASKILQHNPDVDEKKAGKLAAEALKLAGLKLKDNDTVTDALFFISDSQAEALAQLAVSEEKEKSLYKNALKEFPAIDIALFGRMVASDPSLNYDAAAQVAHSISTHKIQNEYDFLQLWMTELPKITTVQVILAQQSLTLLRYTVMLRSMLRN